MIDVHSHILLGIDDGARDLGQALEMARIAVADGIRVMVATPHLFKQRSMDLAVTNEKTLILEHIDIFIDRLAAAGIALEILPGCEFPLGEEVLSLLAEDRVLTINDGQRYLLIELPPFSFPTWRISVSACNLRGSPPSLLTQRGNRSFRKNLKDWDS